jgi:hypothetical protein
MRFSVILLFAWLAVPVFAEEESKADSAAESKPATPETESAEESGASKSGGKFLPIPIIITEPAIGEGLGAGLVYFHADPGTDSKRLTTASELNRRDRKQTPPPTATGVFGFYTNNETAGFGVGHSRTFKEDTWRLTALLADAKIIATYYIADFPFDFSLEGTIAFARVKRRFGNSNLFFGFATSYLDSEITFPLDPALPGDEPLIPGIGFKDVGASLSFLWDSRDDTMMPSSGWLAELSSWHYDEGFGGDYNYTKAKLKVNSFHKLGKKFVLGWRLEGSTSDGDYPFYAAPYVSLRGIPALRYQGKSAGVAEIELRYQFAKRWAVLGFTGEGWTDKRNLADETENDIDAFGFGARWLALPTKNVWVGLDIARGPEEDAFYIQMVHPW